MLHTRRGDLLNNVRSGWVIVHGCNSLGKMGSGFAEHLSRIYPRNRLDYIVHSKSEHGFQLGETLFTKQSDGVHIANAITQLKYGRCPNTVYVDYNAVRKALRQVVKYAQLCGLEIHMPFIGAGLANGDKEKLRLIFEEVFKNHDATLWIKE